MGFFFVQNSLYLIIPKYTCKPKPKLTCTCMYIYNSCIIHEYLNLMLFIRTNFMYSMFSLKLECNITTTPFLYEEASVIVTYNVLIADKHV